LSFFGIFTLAITFACSDDFLDRKPYGATTNADLGFSEDDLYLGAVFDIYGHLRSYDLSALPFVAITSVTSGDADKGSTPSDAPDVGELGAFTFNAANGLIGAWYRGNFTGVTKANEALDYLSRARESDTIRVMRAEARFMRGLYYFNLVRSFGGMPIVDHKLGQNEKTPARSSLAQTYDFIRADFVAAATVLPQKSAVGARWYGRATRGAANAYLAKAALYQKDWQTAYTLTSGIILSGEYNLNTPYNKIFTEAEENGSESVFETQCQQNILYGQSIGSQFAEVQGVRGSLNLGWGFNVPSQQLLSAYEVNDPRQEATVITRGTEVEPGELVPMDADNPYYNKKAYPWKDERTKPNRDFANGYWQKGSWIDIRLMRYADVVLMCAEAANELGNTTEALAKLEMVRARARGSNAILPKVTTTDQVLLRNAIRHERRIELAMEFDRYFDLLRWGIAGEVLGNKWKSGKNELFPIPQSEIDLSGGILTPNPGYN
ncbi:MAG: RagB/SusD family nutrient uptake outer membrane protein, partial [Bacteroidaceae bacterium]